jgi:hypothetical protein
MQRSRVTVYVRIAVTALSLIALVVGCLIFTGTRGGLEFFSPYTLELTTQSEFTVAGAWPLYRSSRRPVSNEILTFVRDERFVVPQPQANGRQLVVFHWNEAWKDGYGPLYDVLHRYRDRVISWCKEDRQRAQLYWAEGFRYLRSENPADAEIGAAILSTCWRASSIEQLEKMIAGIKNGVAL